MKRLWIVVLLISLGLNLGLMWRLAKHRQQIAPRGFERPLAAPTAGDEPGMHPDSADSCTWSRLVDRRVARMCERLELSPGQRELMSELHHGAADELRRRRESMSDAKQHMRTLLERETVPADSLRRAMHEMAAIRTGLDSLVTEFMLQEMEILDHRQRGLYLEMLPIGRGHGDYADGPRGRGRGHGRGKSDR